MDKTYYWGVAIGVLAAVAILGVVLLILKKAGKLKTYRYDERQKIARGQAYQAGFFTMLIYFFAFGITNGLDLIWCETFVGCFIGIVLGAGVFAVTAIRKDAYLALNENMKTFCLVSGLFIAGNLLSTVANIMAGDLIADGMLTVSAVNMLIALLWVVIFIAQLLHYRKVKKQEKAEEEA